MLTILIPSSHPQFSAMIAFGIKKVNKNINIIYMSSHSQTPTAKYSSDIDTFIYCENKDNKINEIIDVVKKYNVDLLYPVDEEGILFCIENYEELSKHTSLTRIAQKKFFNIAKNKWELSKFLASRNCNVARGAISNDDNSLEYPILAKDVNGAFGRGITLLTCEEEYRAYKGQGEVFFEEYIDGYDLVCNVYCQDGNIIAYTILKPVFYGDKGFTSKFDMHMFENNEKVLSLVEKCIKELEWNGIGSLDVRFDKKNNKYVIIEMNPRFWATLVSSITAGVNFPYIVFKDNVESGQNKTTKNPYTFYSLRYLVNNMTIFKSPKLFINSDLYYRFRNVKGTLKSLINIIWRKF